MLFTAIKRFFAIADSLDELKKWSALVISQISDVDTLHQCNIYVFDDDNKIDQVLPLLRLEVSE